MAQDLSGDAASGRTLAQELCSSCRLVEREQRGRVPDGVPSFTALAARPHMTGDRLAGSLLALHPAMPLPPLDRRQQRDVVAYILSLGAR
jgi:hypothetical protein